MEAEQEKTYMRLQPEYVGKFQCDGAVCNSKCCKRWAVDIDGATYQKYCTIEPKTERKKIVSRIKYKKQKNMFFVEMAKNDACPFLRSDGLCYIQKTWGADWLSNTCTMYPRKPYMAGELMMMALTLTCPVAAKQALLPKEPMAFEEVPMTAETQDKLIRRCVGRLSKMGDAFIDIQYGSISILQNRSLAINQRLIVLGFFLDQADDMVKAGTPEQIETLAAVYTAEDFLERVPEMLRAIDFRVAEYVKSMFGLIETLYGKDAKFQGREHSLMRRVVSAFGLKDREVPLADLVETYIKTFRPAQEALLQKFGHIFENYLVNEFFLEHYPQRIVGTLVQNYILFVMTYKLLEFIVVSVAVTGEAEREKEPSEPETGKTEQGKTETGDMDEETLVDLIGHMVASFDHSTEFLKSVAKDALKRQKDVVACMKNLLYAGDEFA